MTRQLDMRQQGPASGSLKSVVIFLHGYGADGADLLGLADPLAEHLPDTLFIAPDAPDPAQGSGMGRQWFPLPWIDGSSEAEAAAGLEQASSDLNAFLDKVMEDNDVSADEIAIVGFSQGSMMALDVVPRRKTAPAAIVAFSGRLLRPEALEADAVSKPPILLCHGDADEVVPFQEMGIAGETLVGAGFDVYAHVMQGTAHGISPDGLSAALGFLHEHLPK